MLSDQLFTSNFTISDTVDSVAKKISSIGESLGIGHGGANFDTRRLAVTVEYMRQFELTGGFCVEIGSLDYLSAKVVWSYFPNASVKGTQNDLRSEPLRFPDNSVDNLICLEVIEHISDISYQQATTLDGLFFFLEEVYRVLRVGGRALISTPNANSLWAMQRVLLRKAPLMYDWHFREYTVEELAEIVQHIGFSIVEHQTEYVWHLWDFSPIINFLQQEGYGLDFRGDDQFIVIEKRAERVRRPHHLDLPAHGQRPAKGILAARIAWLKFLTKIEYRLRDLRKKKLRR